MFAFPSLHEGFGLPPLEAMRMGCPVLTSRAGGLPEVCGDAALYVDPTDRVDITTGISRMLGSKELRNVMVQNGLKQADKFSAASYLPRLAEAYRRLNDSAPA